VCFIKKSFLTELVELGIAGQLVLIRLVKDLFMPVVEFLFQGDNDAVEVIDVAGKMPGGEEFTGCDQRAAFTGEPVGQTYLQTNEIFSCGERVVGNEHLFNLSGLNVIFPGKQAVFEVLVHISNGFC